MPLMVFAIAASLLLQACNTTAGIGRDVSAGADAVTGSAERSKGY
nr:entericidin EcnA/B family protein [Roseovarius autotrophicus]